MSINFEKKTKFLKLLTGKFDWQGKKNAIKKSGSYSTNIALTKKHKIGNI